MKNIKKVHFGSKIVSLAIMFSLLSPFYAKRENILFTNENSYEAITTGDSSYETLFFDAYCDEKSKLEDNNIKTLIIRNSQELTEEEKNIISKNNNLKNLVLTYSLTDINDQNINLDFLSPDVKVNLILDEVIKNFDKDSELYNFLLYKKYKDYKENSNNKEIILLEPFSKDDIEKFELFDDHLNMIVESFDLDENSDEYTKIISIVNFVTRYMHYDEDVSAKNKKGKLKSTNYNKYVLSPTLEQEPYIYCQGICCNYAALTTVLGYYTGVDLEYISGVTKDYGHAWNEYTDNGKEVVFDTTSLDAWNLYTEVNYYYNFDKANGLVDDLSNYNMIKIMESDKNHYTNRYNIYKEYSKDYNLSKIEWIRRLFLFGIIGIANFSLFSLNKIDAKILSLKKKDKEN